MRLWLDLGSGARLEGTTAQHANGLRGCGVSLTSEQLHVLQHALGLDKYGQGEMYRNHFCAGE